MARKQQSKRKKKQFFKHNWDILAIYLSAIIAGVLMWVFLQSCSGWDCLGVIFYLVGGGILVFIFSVIAIIRNFRNKKLSKARWYWLIPFVIALIWLISYL